MAFLFFFSVCRSACKERENKLVCGDVRIFPFEMLYLYFLLFLLLPVSLCFPAIKRLDGPPSSVLYSSYSHGAGLAGLGNKVIPISGSISSNRYQVMPSQK